MVSASASAPNFERCAAAFSGVVISRELAQSGYCMFCCFYRHCRWRLRATATARRTYRFKRNFCAAFRFRLGEAVVRKLLVALVNHV